MITPQSPGTFITFLNTIYYILLILSTSILLKFLNPRLLISTRIQTYITTTTSFHFKDPKQIILCVSLDVIEEYL